MKNYLLLALAAVALCFTACKKNNPEPTPVAVTGVSLDKTMVALEIDESATVKAIIAPENATNKAVEWSVADTAVATVSNGVVTGVAVGETTLTATTADGGFTATIPVKVVAEKVSSITIGAQATKIGIGEVTYLNANLQPEHPDEDGIEWSSSNPGIATVEDSAVKHGAKVTGVAAGKATITATAKDGSGVKGSIEIEVVTVPTSITFDGKTDQEIYTWWGKEVDLKAKVTPDGASLKTLTWIWNDPNASSNPDGLKYNVTDDKATLTYTWPSQTSRLGGVDVRAFYGNGNTVFAKANVYFQTFAWLLKYSEDAINYQGLYPLTQDFDYKWNWEDNQPNKLAFIAYYRSSGNANALPQYYKEYYIPTSEYTLTSSDSSKIKVTKNADGESWDLERINTTDLAAVTLTYKCGSHTQTYTLNLIP
jgi:uncharacterized protein YjdB